MAAVETVNELRHRLIDFRRQVEVTEKAIAAIEQRCNPHRWTEAECESVHYDAYEIPGDPPLEVAAWNENRWRRKCEICGKEQAFGDPNSAPVFHHRPKPIEQ